MGTPVVSKTTWPGPKVAVGPDREVTRIRLRAVKAPAPSPVGPTGVAPLLPPAFITRGSRNPSRPPVGPSVCPDQLTIGAPATACRPPAGDPCVHAWLLGSTEPLSD